MMRLTKNEVLFGQQDTMLKIREESATIAYERSIEDTRALKRQLNKARKELSMYQHIHKHLWRAYKRELREDGLCGELRRARHHQLCDQLADYDIKAKEREIDALMSLL